MTYVEWAGRGHQIVVVPWTVLADREDVADFARRLAAAPVGRRGWQTALSSSLLFCAQQFHFSGLRSIRKVIDISGDGIGDAGPPIAQARSTVLGEGITINGLSLDLKHLDIAKRELFQDAREVRTKFAKTFPTWFFPVGEDVVVVVAEWIAELEAMGFGAHSDDRDHPFRRIATTYSD